LAKCLLYGHAFGSTAANDILQHFAPIFVLQKGEGQSLRDLAEYVDNCQLIDERGKIVYAGISRDRWRSDELIKVIDQDPKDSKIYRDTSRWSIRPKTKNPGPKWNPIVVKDGQAAYGNLNHLNKCEWSAKYFLFFDHNETSYFGGSGNHTGDWICVDLQLFIKTDDKGSLESPDRALIEYIILHNHGRQFLVKKPVLDNGRVIIYLEGGTHEPWPNAGGSGLGGWPSSLLTNKTFPETLKEIGTQFLPGQQAKDDKMIREHGGNGLLYDTRGHIEVIEESNSRSAKLFKYFLGRWGDTKNEITDSPAGPMQQPKMWTRAFTKYPNDPEVDTIWFSRGGK